MFEARHFIKKNSIFRGFKSGLESGFGFFTKAGVCVSKRAHGKTGSKRLEIVQALSVVVCSHGASFKSEHTLTRTASVSFKTQSPPWSVGVVHG